ncbi:MAG: hypothetical protein JNK16_13015 [Phycisphaerales bacterium]|nr:hypothetical protein [Phycisphaerales bacterium]
MTAKKIAKLLSRQPATFGPRGKGAFVVLPYGEYKRLCDAVEDAIDLIDLEAARRDPGAKSLVSWDDAKKKLDAGRSRRSPKRSTSQAKRRAS